MLVWVMSWPLGYRAVSGCLVPVHELKKGDGQWAECESPELDGFLGKNLNVNWLASRRCIHG